ncbi:MAG TPA: hypothetical protein VE135_02095 [Pyrinomonadaceae bacterium]|nr:hypothetical protein [Pyrinomonadaceae bacterium]
MEEGFVEGQDHDELVDDPDRIEGYRAVGLADGFIRGSYVEQLEAWTCLVKSGKAWELGGWFARRAIELLAERRIKISSELLPRAVRNEVDRQRTLAAETEVSHHSGTARPS